jgi:hypothetical protein
MFSRPDRCSLPSPRSGNEVLLARVLVVVAVAAAVTPIWGGSTAALAAPSTSTTSHVSTTATYATPSTTAYRPPSTTTEAAAPTVPPTAATVAPTATSASPTTPVPTPTGDAGVAQLFNGPLVAPVPAADVPVERAMTDVFVVPSPDADHPKVAVQFRSPFPFPSHAYRVSMLVGDPNGSRLRVSLIDAGNGTATWKEERFTSSASAPAVGTAQPISTPTWTPVDMQSTGADFSPTGVAAITVPIKDAPDGAAAWAEVETGTDGTQVSLSPIYSRAALFAPTPLTYPLPSSGFGLMSEADGTSTGSQVVLPVGATVAVSNHAIQMVTSERPPTELAGQHVDKVIDAVKIAPTYDLRGVVTDYVSVDRTTGDVKLFDGLSMLPNDKSGDSSWLTAGLPAGDPGAPTTIQIDLAKAEQALGIDLTGAASGIGIRREYVLANGRRVVAEGVLGTLAWFDPNALAGISDSTATVDGAPLGPVADPETTSPWRALVAGVALALFLIALGVAIVVARRRRRAAVGDAADQLTAIAVETAEHRAITREERKLATTDVPIVDEPLDVEPLDVEPLDVEPLDFESLDDRPPLVALIDLTDPGPAPAGPTRPAKHAPDHALATLGADFDELTARLRSLEDAPSPRRGTDGVGRG